VHVDTGVASVRDCLLLNLRLLVRPRHDQTNCKAQHHRAKSLPSMEKTLLPYQTAVGYPSTLPAKASVQCLFHTPRLFLCTSASSPFRVCFCFGPHPARVTPLSSLSRRIPWLRVRRLCVRAQVRSMRVFDTPAMFAIGLQRRPIYLRGRYLKLARGVSQTQWMVNGVAKVLGAVEELIAGPVVERYKVRPDALASATRVQALTLRGWCAQEAVVSTLACATRGSLDC
jgi:hypothetical protein